MEFGLFLPVLLILFIGAVEIGRVIQHHHIVVKAVRDAGRYLTRVPFPFDATTEANAKNLAMRGTFDSTAPLRLSYWNDAATQISISSVAYDNSAPDFRGGALIERIIVSASVPYQPGFFPGWFGVNTIVFAPSHQQRYIGE